MDVFHSYVFNGEKKRGRKKNNHGNCIIFIIANDAEKLHFLR